MGWRYFYSEPKKKKYQDYYKNFDAEKEAKIMEAEELARKMAPQLRGIVARSLKKDIITASVMGLVAGFAWKFLYADPLRRQYENFYKNYDAEKVAKEMEAELEANQ
ncbi:hypothetical protein QZH41_001165 [Actinostola sp. cb2023]|nr:hypothetical protein QZH41_001165 [Actinostola sp. cb2023]